MAPVKPKLVEFSTEVAEQVRTLRDAGWTRFKIPIALPLDYGRDRLLAAREAAGEDAWVGMDAAWIFRTVDDAVAFLDDSRDARLGWFEAELRRTMALCGAATVDGFDSSLVRRTPGTERDA